MAAGALCISLDLATSVLRPGRKADPIYLECGRESGADAVGWRTFLTHEEDGRTEAATYCPACAELHSVPRRYRPTTPRDPALGEWVWETRRMMELQIIQPATGAVGDALDEPLRAVVTPKPWKWRIIDAGELVVESGDLPTEEHCHRAIERVRAAFEQGLQPRTVSGS